MVCNKTLSKTKNPGLRANPGASGEDSKENIFVFIHKKYSKLVIKREETLDRHADRGSPLAGAAYACPCCLPTEHRTLTRTADRSPLRDRDDAVAAVHDAVAVGVVLGVGGRAEHGHAADREDRRVHRTARHPTPVLDARRAVDAVQVGLEAVPRDRPERRRADLAGPGGVHVRPPGRVVGRVRVHRHVREEQAAGVGALHTFRADLAARARRHVRRAVAVLVHRVVEDLGRPGVDAGVAVVAVGVVGHESRGRTVARGLPRGRIAVGVAVRVRVPRVEREPVVDATRAVVVRAVAHLGVAREGGGVAVVAIRAVADVAEGLVARDVAGGGGPVGVAVAVEVPRALAAHAAVGVVRAAVAVLVHVCRVAHLGRAGVDRDVGIVAIGAVGDVAAGLAARRGGRRGVPVGVAVGVREVGGAAAGLVHGAVAVVVHRVAHLGCVRVDARAGRRVVVAVHPDLAVRADLDVVLRAAAEGEVHADVVRVPRRVVRVDVGPVRRLDSEAVLVVVEREHGADTVGGADREVAAADALRRSGGHDAVLRVDGGTGLRGAAGGEDDAEAGEGDEGGAHCLELRSFLRSTGTALPRGNTVRLSIGKSGVRFLWA